jgi:hypothetical protein
MLQISEENLEAAMRKINHNKAVGVDSISGTIIKLMAEKRTGRLLTILNEVNKTGKIPGINNARSRFRLRIYRQLFNSFGRRTTTLQTFTNAIRTIK